MRKMSQEAEDWEIEKKMILAQAGWVPEGLFVRVEAIRALRAVAERRHDDEAPFIVDNLERMEEMTLRVIDELTRQRGEL